MFHKQQEAVFGSYNKKGGFLMMWCSSGFGLWIHRVPLLSCLLFTGLSIMSLTSFPSLIHLLSSHLCFISFHQWHIFFLILFLCSPPSFHMSAHPLSFLYPHFPFSFMPPSSLDHHIFYRLSYPFSLLSLITSSLTISYIFIHKHGLLTDGFVSLQFYAPISFFSFE